METVKPFNTVALTNSDNPAVMEIIRCQPIETRDPDLDAQRYMYIKEAIHIPWLSVDAVQQVVFQYPSGSGRRVGNQIDIQREVKSAGERQV